MEIRLTPIAFVKNTRTAPTDDFWGGTISEIELAPEMAEETFEGIFAQRNKDRPNHIGLATVELMGHTGRIIKVRYLDALDGTPVLDIKPVFREFMPRGEIRQPDWVGDLLKDYWK